MIHFLVGFAGCAAAVFFYATRSDWLYLRRVWRAEPDQQLRGWLVALRRLTTGYRIDEPTWRTPRPHLVPVLWRA